MEQDSPYTASAERQSNVKRPGQTLILIGSALLTVGLILKVWTGFLLATSFGRIAQSTVAPKPSELADGIGTAMFYSTIGTALIIPGVMLLLAAFWIRLSTGRPDAT